MKKEYVKDFCKDIKNLDGCDAYIVGDVITGKKNASVAEKPNIIECSL